MCSSDLDEELERFTSDNGKLIMQCRVFIPPTAIQLNTLLTILNELEIVLNNNELFHNDLYICNGKINTFAIGFTSYMAQLNM